MILVIEWITNVAVVVIVEVVFNKAGEDKVNLVSTNN